MTVGVILNHLRRHVFVGTTERLPIPNEGREPKIADLGLTVLRQQDIFWLDVTMHNPVGVHRLDRIAHLPEDLMLCTFTEPVVLDPLE